MATIEEDLNQLREFFRRRMDPQGEGYTEDSRKYLHALGEDMLDWAREVPHNEAATGLEDAVRKASAKIILFSKVVGDLPGYEVLIFPPEQTTHEGSGEWRLCYEAGPYAWGVGGLPVPASLRAGPGWYTEPYYNFDICFVPHYRIENGLLRLPTNTAT